MYWCWTTLTKLRASYNDILARDTHICTRTGKLVDITGAVVLRFASPHETDAFLPECLAQLRGECSDNDFVFSHVEH